MKLHKNRNKKIVKVVLSRQTNSTIIDYKQNKIQINDITFSNASSRYGIININKVNIRLNKEYNMEEKLYVGNTTI